MNKRGSSIFFGFTMGLVCFIIGVLIIPFLTDDIVTTRTNLNCTGADTISDGTMIECLQIDLVVPYFIWFFVSLSVGIFAGANK